MELRFSLFDLLLIIGLAQGVITSVLLVAPKKNKVSNRFLAFAIISFCLLSVKMLLHSLGLREDPFLRYFPIGVELLIAPLMYFYVVSLITPKFRFKWTNGIHFVPFVLSQGYSFFVFFLVNGDYTIANKDAIATSLHFGFIKKAEDYLSVLSIGGYLIAGFLRLKDYKEWLNSSISDNTYPNFRWLKNIFLLSLILGIFLLINLSLDAIFNLKAINYSHWQGYYIFNAALIYYLGFVGYMQPDYRFEALENVGKPAIEKLTDDKKRELTNVIEKALEIDKVFLNPTISAKELAKLLGISQSNLSYVINDSFKKTFRDLINEYRIKEVKSKLKDINLRHMSVLGIALECGFNSEASFYRIFKKSTGLSPVEYLNQHRSDKQN